MNIHIFFFTHRCHALDLFVQDNFQCSSNDNSRGGESGIVSGLLLPGRSNIFSSLWVVELIWQKKNEKPPQPFWSQKRSQTELLKREFTHFSCECFDTHTDVCSSALAGSQHNHYLINSSSSCLCDWQGSRKKCRQNFLLSLLTAIKFCGAPHIYIFQLYGVLRNAVHLSLSLFPFLCPCASIAHFHSPSC